MMKPSLLLFFAALATFAQDYKLEPIATVAPDLPAAYSAEIAAQGYRVVGPSGPWCEVWFRKSIPTGAKPSDVANKGLSIVGGGTTAATLAAAAV